MRWKRYNFYCGNSDSDADEDVYLNADIDTHKNHGNDDNIL